MLDQIYDSARTASSDINEHIETLKNIAENSIRFADFSPSDSLGIYGILKGLNPNNPDCQYIKVCRDLPEQFQKSMTMIPKNKSFFHASTLIVEPHQIGDVDALFIDSIHTYVHLTYELEKFHSIVSKTICIHDTSFPWGELNDTSYTGDYSEYPKNIDRTKKGTWAAITDFIAKHPEWKIKIRMYNNHGFTILHKESRIYPITFGIPECKVVESMPEKNRLLAPLIPGDLNTYIYDDENEYRLQYSESFFALTKKKEGWDCMRHYEIMACGCIPVFENIENKPKKTLHNFPVELFERFKLLYNAAQIVGIEDEEFLTSYRNLWMEMMVWFRNNCTTERIAEYMLSNINVPKSEKILCIPGAWYPDYLAVTVIHGLKMKYGKNCVEFPHLQYLYDGHEINQQSMYGKGFSYSGTLNKNEHWAPGFENWRVIRELISNHYFDIIVFASSCCGTPFENIVRRVYSDNEIIYINGADEAADENRLVSKGVTFVRELI